MAPMAPTTGTVELFVWPLHLTLSFGCFLAKGPSLVQQPGEGFQGGGGLLGVFVCVWGGLYGHIHKSMLVCQSGFGALDGLWIEREDLQEVEVLITALARLCKTRGLTCLFKLGLLHPPTHIRKFGKMKFIKGALMWRGRF